MAGLARIQQRFTTALIGTLAALVGFARGGDKQAAAHLASHGHPILRKYLRDQNPAEVRTRYQGSNYRYCMGKRETERRLRKMFPWRPQITQTYVLTNRRTFFGLFTAQGEAI